MMTDPIYLKVREQVEGRSGHPRFAALNALLFTLFTVIFGVGSLFTRLNGSIDGVIYWIIFFWSIILFAHVGIVHVRSAARRKTRQTIIQQEVLKVGETYNLTPEEMIDIHLQLDADLQLRTQAVQRLFTIASGNLVLWPGLLLVSIILYNGLHIISESAFVRFFTLLLQLGLMGTLVSGLGIPIRTLWQKPAQQTDDLRAIYGYKRKRELSEPANQPIEENEDELVDYDEYEQVQKQR